MYTIKYDIALKLNFNVKTILYPTKQENYVVSLHARNYEIGKQNLLVLCHPLNRLNFLPQLYFFHLGSLP